MKKTILFISVGILLASCATITDYFSNQDRPTKKLYDAIVTINQVENAILATDCSEIKDNEEAFNKCNELTENALMELDKSLNALNQLRALLSPNENETKD